MAIRFHRLFDYLTRHDLKKGDLKTIAGLSSVTIAKLSKGGNVELEIINRICKGLDVQPEDIMEYVPDND